ncbi:MAG TPA: hypothetical protein VIO58_05545 [Candidatus Methanoperedens sp.]
MALELVKCPYCGFKFRIDIGKQEKDGETFVYRSFVHSLISQPRRVKTIDIECLNPSCKKTFEHPVES